MARARLRERHQDNLRRKLQLLKQEQGVHTATTTTDTKRYRTNHYTLTTVISCQTFHPLIDCKTKLLLISLF